MPKIDYITINYCATCKKRFPKNTIRCDECGMMIRTKPSGRYRQSFNAHWGRY